jgi:hypothetical protein
MYIDLQYRELESTVARAILRERVADDMFALLLPNASHWDAPLDQLKSPMVEMPELPAAKPDWLSPVAPPAAPPEGDAIPGSNSRAAGRPPQQPWRFWPATCT